jgi:hypothetical protein
MAKRKRPTRSSNTLSVALPKPRNTVLQAAARGNVKLGTSKHEKSNGALRRAGKVALSKSVAKLNDD